MERVAFCWTLLGGGVIVRNRGRLYDYVENSPSGWTVAIRDEPHWASPIDYPTQEEAVAAAIHLARHDWQARGFPTGVRVCGHPGARWDECTFGDGPVPPASQTEPAHRMPAPTPVPNRGS